MAISIEACVFFLIKTYSFEKNVNFFEYIGNIGEMPKKEDFIGKFLKI
jgi:hypothetical protein